jgi:hypothetical protein
LNKFLATLILASSSLAACQSTSTGGGCPPLVAYNADIQRQVAAELRRLPKGSPLAQMIIDYKKTRDACRAAG